MHVERRFTNLTGTRPTIETRGEGDDAQLTIVGYAAVFYREGDPTTEFRMFDDLVERVMPTAFDAAFLRVERERSSPITEEELKNVEDETTARPRNPNGSRESHDLGEPDISGSS